MARPGRVPRSHRFPMLRPEPSHNSQWGCRPWGLEDGQPPRYGGIYSVNQALLHCYEPTTAYLDRFYISFLQCILPSWSFTAYDSLPSSSLAKPSKGTAGGLALLGSSDKSRSTCNRRTLRSCRFRHASTRLELMQRSTALVPCPCPLHDVLRESFGAQMPTMSGED